MIQIFVSHAEEDQDLAIEFASSLEKCGFAVWYYERDAVPGVSYLDQVFEAIEQCEAFLLLISPDSLNSEQVDREVFIAFEMRKQFFPVLNNIKHVEFQKRNPAWRMAIGAATSIAIPSTGISAIIDRIETGLKRLGIQSALEPLRSQDLTSSPRSTPELSNDTVNCTLFAPPDISPGSSQEMSHSTEIGQVILFQDSMLLASQKFKIRTMDTSAPADRSPEEVRPHKAYLCYAAKDRAEVLRRVTFLSAMGMEWSADFMNLRSGEKWRDQCCTMIDEADLFILFWSEAASRSARVKKEWRYAIEKKGLDYIRPIAIELPSPPPPPELSELNFMSSLAYL